MPESIEFFLHRKFQEYYAQHPLKSIARINEREFGIGVYGKKITQRHISFATVNDLNQFLREQAPMYISYSNAYYTYPSKQPMPFKQLKGSDITYEFDADDIPTNCKQSHDQWQCVKCTQHGKGVVDKCPACGSSVRVNQWYCPECLQATQDQMQRLLSVLSDDFDFTKDLSLNFSGNAGFHVHLEGKQIQTLSQEARIQLLNYLTFHELDVKLQGFLVRSDKMIVGPSWDQAKGIQLRLLNGVINVVKEKSVEDLMAYGFIPSKKGRLFLERVHEFLDRKEILLEKLKQGIWTGWPSSSVKDSEAFWQAMLRYVMHEQTLALDRQSSVDLHKIMRLPDSLHGSTGLLAFTFPVSKLKSVQPLREGIVFSDSTVKVFIENAPPFYLGNQYWGPFSKEFCELPEYVALYLLGKGAARLP